MSRNLVDDWRAKAFNVSLLTRRQHGEFATRGAQTTQCTLEARKLCVPRSRYWTRARASYSRPLRVFCAWAFKGRSRSSRFDTNRTVMATWKFRSIISRRSCKTGAAQGWVFCRSEQRSPSEPLASAADHSFSPFHFYSRPWRTSIFFCRGSSCFAHKRETMIETPFKQTKFQPSLAAWIFLSGLHLSAISFCVPFILRRVFRDFCALGNFRREKKIRENPCLRIYLSRYAGPPMLCRIVPDSSPRSAWIRHYRRGTSSDTSRRRRWRRRRRRRLSSIFHRVSAYPIFRISTARLYAGAHNLFSFRRSVSRDSRRSSRVYRLSSTPAITFGSVRVFPCE